MALAAVFSGPLKVQAGSETLMVDVLTTVQRSCSIEATPLSFPDYEFTRAEPTTATASITVDCNENIDYSIRLGPGMAESGGSRRMRATGQNYINYDLYSDADHMTVWGEAGVRGEEVGGSSQFNAMSTPHTVYGMIPSGQLSRVENGYSDMVGIQVVLQ